jgi:ERCC4-type nuclease
MIEHYDFPILLIEGNWRQVADGKVISSRGLEYHTWSMIWNYIRSQQHKGITIELTLSLSHTVKRLNELFAWYQKPFHAGGLSHNSYTDDRIMAFPTGCRGKTAMNVLDIFKSLTAVGNADEQDFLHVEGVGEKKAKLIWQHFNRGISFEQRIEAIKEIEELIEPEEEIKEEEQGKLI